MTKPLKMSRQQYKKQRRLYDKRRYKKLQIKRKNQAVNWYKTNRERAISNVRRWQKSNQKKVRLMQAKSRVVHKVTRQVYNAKWAKNNSARRRKGNRKRRLQGYGITPKQRLEMARSQKHRCWTCNKKER